MAEKLSRCAIYTRKSTDDGLDQEFNSLDAQHEACAAYALSQRHEGWMLLPDRYDDGGFSGGNLQRPGLQRLLADVAAGKVDIILVYKIDRLTRSLADFAKIVEVLDRAGASFVSITQSFNTTTSMGRLTLNMLLSFAQFEREVTGERIRDKISASKRRGIWMGGPVPLGYEVRDRKLAVNDAEAELVRHIMRRYLEAESVVELADELTRQGHRTKVQQRASGPHRGGCLFRRGTIYHLLSNRIYRGMIVHKGEAHPGEHEPIVSQELWDDVQRTLAARAQGTARRLKVRQPSLLTGLLTDGVGRSMTPVHSTKSSFRYRYYVTRPDLIDGSPAWRVSAHDLERLVCNRIAAFLVDVPALSSTAGQLGEDAQVLSALINTADVAAATLRSGSAHSRADLVKSVVDKIQLHEAEICINLAPQRLLAVLGASTELNVEAELLVLICPAVKVRRGHQIRLVIPGPDAPLVRPERDEKLVALLADAHAARQLVAIAPHQPIASIAKAANRCRTRLGRLLQVACLAPDIVTAVVEGRQPRSLTSRSLLECELPMEWPKQRALLGFS